MPIVKLSADKRRRAARVNQVRMKAGGEAAIQRHADADDTSTDKVDFTAALANGEARIVQPLDVGAIRAKTGLSQERFARAVRISPHTLRNWEQGRRLPHGPARALLLAIDRDPKAVLRALKAA